jgi:DNA-binding SARP family transcriptional activator
MPKGESVPGWSTTGQSNWGVARELLAAGQYERVARLLGEAQAAYERAGDVGLAQMLAAARGICLACSRVRAEGEWHLQAQQEAGQREHELRQQLQAILDLEDGGASPAQPGLSGPGTSPSPRRPGLRQRIRGLLREWPSPWSIRPKAHAPFLQAPTSLESAETPMAPPIVREEKQVAPALAVYCLGPFRVYQDDQPVTNWPSGKGKCVFKYMAANRRSPIPKDVLMDLFWRDTDPDAARNNLNVAIHGLRQALRAVRPDFSHILFQDDCYLLNPALGVWIDVEEFMQRYEAGQTLERRGELAGAIREYEAAEGLYQGDFLEEDLYEEWPMARREGLKDSYLFVLDRLSRHYLDERRYAACIHLSQKILAKDNCREEAHRRLMRCYSRQGQRNLALRQYHFCAETLARELEVSPTQETVALYDQIRRGETV